jgi:3-hydroxyacyl-CoA dehydrogenase
MRIAVAGTGSIGVAFALVFARAGASVQCWDPMPGALERARADLETRARTLHRHGLLDDPDEVLAGVGYTADLRASVAGAALVQECAPEDLDLKREIHTHLGELTGEDVVLASSSSAITASRIASGLPGAHRIVIGHPGNPPYLLPVVEVVPGETTSSDVVQRAARVYSDAGLHPVVLGKEAEGFVFNRLQGAVLREAYCLVRDGVASVADIDAVMRLGLGRRWGVVGPFETVDLNTRGGIGVHAVRMGPAYARMGAERGQHDPWTEDLVDEVVRQRRALLPLADWEDRVLWRDERLMDLIARSREVAR